MSGESLRWERVCKQYSATRAVNGVPVPRPSGRVGRFFRTWRLGQNNRFNASYRVQGTNLWPNRPSSVLTWAARVQRNILWCFDESFLHPSIFESVAFALKMRGLSGSELRTRVAEALSMFQLDDYQRCMFRQLSDDRQRRGAFARSCLLSHNFVKGFGSTQLELKRLQKPLEAAW